MTRDEATEAGLLVDALEQLPELISEVRAEIDGPFEANTPWKALRLEFWGQDHEDDSSQQCVGGVALPPTMALEVAKTAKALIEARLRTIGVEF